MRKQITATAIAIILTLSQTGFAEDMPEYAMSGNWSIRVDTSLDYGCFLLTTYQDGSAFRLGVDRTDGSVYVLVADPNWESIEYGKHYPVSLQFGDESPWTADATGFSFDPPEDQPFLAVHASTDRDTMWLFLREFMVEPNFELFYKGSSVANLSLKGSYAATLKLLECQSEINTALDRIDPFDEQLDPFGEPSNKPVLDPFAS
jgi:hypothetical protein